MPTELPDLGLNEVKSVLEVRDMGRSAGLAAALVAAVLVACGGPTGSGGPPADSGDQTSPEDLNRVAAAGVGEGGDLRWPVDEVPANWNANQVDGATASGYTMLAPMLPHLFRQNADATIAPNTDYLTSAEVTSSDPQVVTYLLNPKARWNDGRPISWEDFAAQARALSGKRQDYRAALTTGYEDIAVVERGAAEWEVKVTFARTFAEWKTLFTLLYPKELNATPDAFSQAWVQRPTVTAGPFKFGSADQTAKVVTLERDEAWWGVKPKLDRIIFRVVERPSLADALANGAIDFYEVGASVDLYERARKIPGVIIRQAVAADYAHVTFNGAAGSILADQELRVAIMRGIDTKIIAKALTGVMVRGEPRVVGNHIFLPGNANYRDHSSLASYDPAKARSKIEELGWKLVGDQRIKDGKRLVVRYTIPSPSAPNEETAKLVQGQLKAIGVEVEIVAVPSADYLTKYVFTGNFDLAGFRWGGSISPVSTTKAIYFLDPAATMQNFGRVGNESINELYRQARSELDDARRAELANQIDEEIWKTAHQLPLYQMPGAVAVRSSLANLGAMGYGEYDYSQIGFVK